MLNTKCEFIQSGVNIHFKLAMSEMMDLSNKYLLTRDLKGNTALITTVSVHAHSRALRRETSSCGPNRWGSSAGPLDPVRGGI